ncbi:MAG: tRNA pseudouridine(55) synthase TruB [Bacteroidetes bacterium]|nr:tRNA pseudouridine(55) synthase TruB [Bacteroidota bacterium]MDA1119737.1 tRNA pseudouridine(55) synthase TruB [Bacteroidota bacterium]
MITSTRLTDLSSIDFTEGCVIPIDKDLNWTSFDVVNKIRNTIPVRKVGHAGTLDPLASGLVLLCTGKYTKKINELMGQDKEYEGSLVLGKTTASVDLETPLEDGGDYNDITDNDIQEAVKTFIGKIAQVPPIYSAIKVDGERAYKKARKNEKPKLEAREVRIDEFSITKINLPQLHFKLICSKGTYVRSLVRDMGDLLGCGAYLESLRRTKIGDYNVMDAWTVGEFVNSYRTFQ